MRKFIRNFSLLSSAGILILCFQNCTGQSLNLVESLATPVDPSYFNYKYSSASPYYFDVKVLKGPAESGVQTFQIAGSIAKSNPEDISNLAWRIRLVATDGSYTPTVSGNNQIDGTLVFVDDIVGLANKTFEKLWVEITYNGGSPQVYEIVLDLD